MKNKEEYTSYGNKLMNNMWQTNTHQRSINSTVLKSSISHDTQSKSKMRDKSNNN